MKIFIFDWIEKLTTNYHEGGGATVISNTLDEAIQLLKNINDEFSISEEEYRAVIEFEIIGTPEPIAYIFPDKGCC